jgi:hypothetical protein
MSFLRHGQIYRPMGSSLRAGGEAVFCYAPATHRLDESAAGYSLAGCSPAEPASASPADTIFIPSAETVNRHRHRDGGFFDQQNEDFSIGIDSIQIQCRLWGIRSPQDSGL